MKYLWRGGRGEGEGGRGGGEVCSDFGTSPCDEAHSQGRGSTIASYNGLLCPLIDYSKGREDHQRSHKVPLSKLF